ncbi:MAG: hypothetical protein IPI44_12195 [Sulfuritalea sp.]|nr:hypothetical protein [Sulfuritalea sp.]
MKPAATACRRFAELCDSCNMRDRYGPVELAKVGASLATIRLQAARSAIES